MQQSYLQHQASPAEQQRRQAAKEAAVLQQEAAATHDDNEWGIEVVSESASGQAQQQGSGAGSTQQQVCSNRKSYDHSLPQGLHYETPVSAPGVICIALASSIVMQLVIACSVQHHPVNCNPKLHTLCVYILHNAV